MTICRDIYRLKGIHKAGSCILPQVLCVVVALVIFQIFDLPVNLLREYLTALCKCQLDRSIFRDAGQRTAGLISGTTCALNNKPFRRSLA